jgi:acetyl esterase/lipase
MNETLEPEASSIPEANTVHITHKHFDLPYAGLSPAQQLDIYWPETGDGPFPVILSIHGGAFMMGDKRDDQVKPMLVGLERGYAVVSMNYRMSGEAIFPALVQDAKAAVRWVRAHAGEYHFDPKKIAAWGGSAGGYLSLMVAVTAGVPELEDLSLGNPDQPCNIQAVVDWFGPTDFLKMDEQLAESGLAPTPEGAHNAAHSPESLILGRQITEIPELVRAANPETYLRPGAPPCFIQHGLQDDTVPYQQSANFAAMAARILGPERVSLELIPGAVHADPYFEDPENVNKVLDFLDRHLQ